MAWIGGLIAGVGALAGGAMSRDSSKDAARASRYQYMPTILNGVGSATSYNGSIRLQGDRQFNADQATLHGLQQDALGRYEASQYDRLGTNFLRGSYGSNDAIQQGLFSQLMGQANTSNPYASQDFMGGVNGGMLQGIDPNAMAQNYTDLLRQQALPQEQQATNSLANRLFGQGRLGTTGGANMMGQMQQAQQQADIGRQVAGQQYGLQQGLMAQQGYDQARAAQQGLMLNQFGANQQGMMNQFGMDQGMFGRMLDMYNSGSDMTQDRFNRALQLFGGENAMNQQYLSDYSGLLGAAQSQQQTLMDLGRLGGSVGQAQTAANANAAQIRNQGNQDMIAGFLSGLNNWNNSRTQGSVR